MKICNTLRVVFWLLLGLVENIIIYIQWYIKKINILNFLGGVMFIASKICDFVNNENKIRLTTAYYGIGR